MLIDSGTCLTANELDLDLVQGTLKTKQSIIGVVDLFAYSRNYFNLVNKKNEPFKQVNDVSGLVTHNLCLDVSRLQDQLLDEDAAVAESFFGFRSAQAKNEDILHD
jgi:hypothetical protein